MAVTARVVDRSALPRVRGFIAFQIHCEGEQVGWLAMCAYEFSEGKIQRMRTAYARLSILKQAAKGCLEETVVSFLVKRAEKGLY